LQDIRGNRLIWAGKTWAMRLSKSSRYELVAISLTLTQLPLFEQTLCPPREVRSFRILVVQDARTIRRPANRTALLTVWNVLQLNLAEGSSAGSFECGQRFLVGFLSSLFDHWLFFIDELFVRGMDIRSLTCCQASIQHGWIVNLVRKCIWVPDKILGGRWLRRLGFDHLFGGGMDGMLFTQVLYCKC
jgi:hypothetical protein